MILSKNFCFDFINVNDRWQLIACTLTNTASHIHSSCIDRVWLCVRLCPIQTIFRTFRLFRSYVTSCLTNRFGFVQHRWFYLPNTLGLMRMLERIWNECDRNVCWLISNGWMQWLCDRVLLCECVWCDCVCAIGFLPLVMIVNVCVE